MFELHVPLRALALLWLAIAASKPALAAPHSRFEEPQLENQSAKKETEELLNMLVPVAQRMLEKNGEFFPLGAALSSDGKLAGVTVAPTQEHPSAQDVIDELLRAFRVGAQRGTYRATGLAIDVLTTPPGAVEKTDAVEVRLEHVSGYSIRVAIPYHLSNRVVTFGKIFAMPGTHDVFPAVAH